MVEIGEIVQQVAFEGIPLRGHLDQLNTILLELRNINVKMEDDNAALILLVSLHYYMKILCNLSLLVKILYP